MHFEKISKNQWDMEIEKVSNPQISELDYANVKLPKRSTARSAGYDFYSPCSFTIYPHESIKIPSGIRCLDMPKETVLLIVVRSSIGIKRHLGLSNQVGVIDPDYCFAENEGHIMIALDNNSDKLVEINAGERIAQGIFTQFFITEDDDATGERIGGIGSTGK